MLGKVQTTSTGAFVHQQYQLGLCRHVQVHFKMVATPNSMIVFETFAGLLSPLLVESSPRFITLTAASGKGPGRPRLTWLMDWENLPVDLLSLTNFECLKHRSFCLVKIFHTPTKSPDSRGRNPAALFFFFKFLLDVGGPFSNKKLLQDQLSIYATRHIYILALLYLACEKPTMSLDVDGVGRKQPPLVSWREVLVREEDSQFFFEARNFSPSFFILFPASPWGWFFGDWGLTDPGFLVGQKLIKSSWKDLLESSLLIVTSSMKLLD